MSNVCYLVLLNHIGKSLCTVPGFHRERAKGDTPTIGDRRRPNLTLPPPLRYPGVSGSSPLHLNYVAGYTGPLLFLFERTHNYYVGNQGLVPWRLCRLGRSKLRSASLVKVLSDVKISWDPRSQLSWNPPPPTTQSNTYLSKSKKTEGEGAPASEKPSLSHFQYGNTTELGADGQFVTTLDSSGSVRPACFKLGLPIWTHEQDYPHAHDNYNQNRIVRERGRQVIRNMWRVEQVHDVIGIFYYTRCVCDAFFLSSFFLYFRRPNLTTD